MLFVQAKSIETKKGEKNHFTMKNWLLTLLTAFIAGLLGSFAYDKLTEKEVDSVTIETIAEDKTPIPTVTSYEPVSKEIKTRPEVDFVDASARSTQSVVFIKNVSQARYGRSSWFDFFFGEQVGQQISTGSGVIYTADGYIVTNNHVIEGADEIEVILNKKTYPAELVGSDPSTDLAVLKIEERDLPNIRIGSSKDLAVGAWVLAVGNPFNLTSTVTAGIVSAKGRELNIVRDNFPIESFIQTDAAINPGNSGGALVNEQGELVGINTAIISKTGSYAGYGFAVPVDIMKKVVDDIIEFGQVQKVFIGADVVDIDSDVAKQLDLKNYDGVVVGYLESNGAAADAGLLRGDVLLEIDNQPINSRSAFEEVLSYYSPGDDVNIKYKRDDKVYNERLTLRNRLGTTDVLRRETYKSAKLAVELEKVPKVECERLGIKSGVRVGKISSGLFSRLDIEEGFIITSINNNRVKSPEELAEILERIQGRVRIEGINKRGIKGYYTYYFQ